MDKIEDAGGGLQGHARGRARAQGRDQEGTAAQAGEAPRAQVGRGVRLVARAVLRGLGPRRHAFAGLRRPPRGPRVLRQDRQGQDPHGRGPGDAHGRRHLVVAEHRAPPAELQVRGDEHRLPLVGVGEHLEERARRRDPAAGSRARR